MSNIILGDQPIKKEEVSQKDGEYLDGLKRLNVGSGQKTMKTDDDGFYLGADKFADAPFSVDYTGKMKANSGTFAGELQAVTGTLGALNIASGGNIKLGKTAYADDTNAGFWLGDDSGTAKFKMGVSGSKYFSYNGSDLDIVGGAIKGSTIEGGVIQTNTSGSGFNLRLGYGYDSVEFMYNGSTKGKIYANSNGDMAVDANSALYLTYNADGGSAGFAIFDESHEVFSLDDSYKASFANDVYADGDLLASGGVSVGGSMVCNGDIKTGDSYKSSDGSTGVNSTGFSIITHVDVPNQKEYYHNFDFKDGLVTDISGEHSGNAN